MLILGLGLALRTVNNGIGLGFGLIGQDLGLGLSHRGFDFACALTQLLHVPAYRLTAVGRLLHASVIWNSLPPAVQSSATLSVFFCQRLKTHLFRKLFPDLLL